MKRRASAVENFKTLVLCLLMAACKPKEVRRDPSVAIAISPSVLRAPQTMPWLDFASRLSVSTRLASQYAAAGTGIIRFFEGDTAGGEAHFAGDAQLLESLDLDADGQSDWFLGVGRSRKAPNAAMAAYFFWGGDLGKRVTLELPRSSRAEFVGFAQAREGFWFAAFLSKFDVAIFQVRAKEGRSFAITEVARRRVLGGIAGYQGQLVVSSLYGESGDVDGGVFAMSASGDWLALPSVGGARGLASLGEDQLVYADGWDKDYGKKAEALLTFAHKQEGGWGIEKRLRIEGRFGFKRLRVRGGGSPLPPRKEWVLMSGEAPALVWLGSERIVQLGTSTSEDLEYLDADGDGQSEFVVVGDNASGWKIDSASMLY